jgi:predicted helicase
VTNHGFLDNVTFRGMRQQLLTSFPRVTVIDLHGNQRGGERAPDGRHDESVFAIEQGVAVSLLRRPMETSGAPEVRYAQLWGRRSAKLQTLGCHTAGTLPSVRLQPRSPSYYFVPKRDHLQTGYERGYRLPDLMPVHSTAAVTARDALVVAFSVEELRERMAILADARVPDEVVRSRFFQASRSPKYARGDTRGWQLQAARQRLRREPQWERHIRTCLYRPFDRRKIFWVSWMIDWPRPAMMRHLERGPNLALIARRQTPPSQPCRYFWISDTVVVDGLIRSDNRGSESVFPLMVYSDHRQEVTHSHPSEKTLGGTPNFEPLFLAECAARYALRPTRTAPSRGGHRGEALDLFHYIYALFHAPSYRRQFADWLHTDYPRVFLPRRPELFRALARAGTRLVRKHLQWDRATEQPKQADFGDGISLAQTIRIDAGYPKYAGDRVWWNASTSIGPVAPEVWAFRVGTYQVCRKWIRDRGDRPLTPGVWHEYRQILAAIHATNTIARQIDQHIDRHGGWALAFD